MWDPFLTSKWFTEHHLCFLVTGTFCRLLLQSCNEMESKIPPFCQLESVWTFLYHLSCCWDFMSFLPVCSFRLSKCFWKEALYLNSLTPLRLYHPWAHSRHTPSRAGHLQNIQLHTWRTLLTTSWTLLQQSEQSSPANFLPTLQTMYPSHLPPVCTNSL